MPLYHCLETKPTRTLLLLHPLLGSTDSLKPMVKAIDRLPNHSFHKRYHQTLYIDLPNHGKSTECGSLSQAYGDMKKEVLNVVDMLGIEKVSIIGHSMGGKLAQVLALEEPHRLEDVVVIDASPANYDHDHSAVFKAMKKIQEERIYDKGKVVDALKELEVDEANISFIMMNFANDHEKHRPWMVNVDQLLKDHWEVMKFPDYPNDVTFDGPILFLGGTSSTRLTEKRYIDQVYKRFPNAKVEMLNGGHFIHYEQQKKVCEILDKWWQ